MISFDVNRCLINANCFISLLCSHYTSLIHSCSIVLQESIKILRISRIFMILSSYCCVLLWVLNLFHIKKVRKCCSLFFILYSQDSVLDSILFLLYINNLCKCQCEGSLTCFADDIELCFSSSDKFSLFRSIQIDLDKLKLWFTFIKMVLSIKTKYMNFLLRYRDLGNFKLYFRRMDSLLNGHWNCDKCIKPDKCMPH